MQNIKKQIVMLLCILLLGSGISPYLTNASEKSPGSNIEISIREDLSYNLTATPTPECNAILLEWKDVHPGQWYMPYMITADGPYPLLDYAIPETQYLHTERLQNVEYCYYIQAFDVNGVEVGDKSKTVCVTINCATTQTGRCCPQIVEGLFSGKHMQMLNADGSWSGVNVIPWDAANTSSWKNDKVDVLHECGANWIYGAGTWNNPSSIKDKKQTYRLKFTIPQGPCTQITIKTFIDDEATFFLQKAGGPKKQVWTKNGVGYYEFDLTYVGSQPENCLSSGNYTLTIEHYDKLSVRYGLIFAADCKECCIETWTGTGATSNCDTPDGTCQLYLSYQIDNINGRKQYSGEAAYQHILQQGGFVQPGNGQLYGNIVYNTTPKVVQNRTLLPPRDIANWVPGAYIHWKVSTKEAIILIPKNIPCEDEKDQYAGPWRVAILKIGNNQIRSGELPSFPGGPSALATYCSQTNDNTQLIPSPISSRLVDPTNPAVVPIIIGGFTMVQLRAITEVTTGSSSNVHWLPQHKTASIWFATASRCCCEWSDVGKITKITKGNISIGGSDRARKSIIITRSGYTIEFTLCNGETKTYQVTDDFMDESKYATLSEVAGIDICVRLCIGRDPVNPRNAREMVIKWIICGTDCCNGSGGRNPCPCGSECEWTKCAIIQSVVPAIGTTNRVTITIKDCATGAIMQLMGDPNLFAINANTVTWGGSPTLVKYQTGMCAKYCIIKSDTIPPNYSIVKWEAIAPTDPCCCSVGKCEWTGKGKVINANQSSSSTLDFDKNCDGIKDITYNINYVLVADNPQAYDGPLGRYRGCADLCIDPTTNTVIHWKAYPNDPECCPQLLCPECPGNIVKNWGFTQGLVTGPMPTGKITDWTLAYGSPDVGIEGCCDNGIVNMWGNKVVGEAIQQSVNFVAGRKYKVSFYGRRHSDWATQPDPGDPPMFAFRASNSQLNNPTDPNGIFIGTSSAVTTADCVLLELPEWTAPANYNTLTVSVTNTLSINDGKMVSKALIDRICITEIRVPVCLECPGNIVKNWGFTQGLVTGPMPTGKITDWTLAYGSPDVGIEGCCGDNGIVNMWGNKVVGEAIQQSVNFVAGRKYKVSFYGRRHSDWATQPDPGDPPMFAFRASNSPLGSPTDPNGIFIGTSSAVTTADCVLLELPEWTAPANYNTLTVSVTNTLSINDGKMVSKALIDRICITEVVTNTCCEWDMPFVPGYPTEMCPGEVFEYKPYIVNKCNYALTFTITNDGNPNVQVKHGTLPYAASYNNLVVPAGGTIYFQVKFIQPPCKIGESIMFNYSSNLNNPPANANDRCKMKPGGSKMLCKSCPTCCEWDMPFVPGYPTEMCPGEVFEYKPYLVNKCNYALTFTITNDGNPNVQVKHGTLPYASSYNNLVVPAGQTIYFHVKFVMPPCKIGESIMFNYSSNLNNPPANANDRCKMKPGGSKMLCKSCTTCCDFTVTQKSQTKTSLSLCPGEKTEMVYTLKNNCKDTNIQFTLSSKDVTFSQSNITLTAGSSVDFTAYFTMPRCKTDERVNFSFVVKGCDKEITQTMTIICKDCSICCDYEISELLSPKELCPGEKFELKPTLKNSKCNKAIKFVITPGANVLINGSSSSFVTPIAIPAGGTMMFTVTYVMPECKAGEKANFSWTIKPENCEVKTYTASISCKSCVTCTNVTLKISKFDLRGGSLDGSTTGRNAVSMRILFDVNSKAWGILAVGKCYEICYEVKSNRSGNYNWGVSIKEVVCPSSIGNTFVNPANAVFRNNFTFSHLSFL